MVYVERVNGTTRLTGGASGGGGGDPIPGPAGEDGEDGLTPSLRGVSATSLAIGTGDKTFAINPAMNVAFPVGTMVRATGATTTNYMTGQVTAATTTSVTINVTETGGVGTFNAWVLTVAGLRGTKGDRGTRWGTTDTWVFQPTGNALVVFEDGLPPAVGDLVVTSNGFDPGGVYVVTGVVDSTHADLDVTGITLRGPQGPPGDNALVGWPVGSVFIGFGPVSPATLLGGGTWELFAQGQTLVGFKATDPDFDTDGKQGGEKEHTLTIAEMPNHDHGPGSYDILRKGGAGTGTGVVRGNSVTETNYGITGLSGTRGGGGAHNNMPPYIVVHFWRRTA